MMESDKTSTDTPWTLGSKIQSEDEVNGQTSNAGQLRSECREKRHIIERYEREWEQYVLIRDILSILRLAQMVMLSCVHFWE